MFLEIHAMMEEVKEASERVDGVVFGKDWLITRTTSRVINFLAVPINIGIAVN